MIGIFIGRERVLSANHLLMKLLSRAYADNVQFSLWRNRLGNIGNDHVVAREDNQARWVKSSQRHGHEGVTKGPCAASDEEGFSG